MTRARAGQPEHRDCAALPVYADERLLVLNKPAGVSLATRRTDPHGAAQRLLGCLPKEFIESYALDAGTLWLVHRLDVATTGLVLLARDEDTHRQLSTWVSQGQIEKTYLALVWGHPRPASGTFTSPVGPDPADRRRMKVTPHGSPAVTRFETIGRAPHVSLLQLHPETGRTHQLRVHLSNAGHWIVGDDLYGGARHRGVRDPSIRAALAPPHLLLHAWRIGLPEHSRLVPRRFEASLPAAFADALAAVGLTVPE